MQPAERPAQQQRQQSDLVEQPERKDSPGRRAFPQGLPEQRRRPESRQDDRDDRPGHRQEWGQRRDDQESAKDLLERQALHLVGGEGGQKQRDERRQRRRA